MCGCAACGGGCARCGEACTCGASSQADELEFAAELLDTADPRELDGWINAVLKSGNGVPLPAALQEQLRRILGVLARGIVPIAGRPTGLSTARSAQVVTRRSGRLLGIELEGLSAEDAELAAARQLVRLIRLAGAAATRLLPELPPDLVVIASVLVASRRVAPGLAPRFAMALDATRRGRRFRKPWARPIHRPPQRPPKRLPSPVRPQRRPALSRAR